eukprot:500682_1
MASKDTIEEKKNQDIQNPQNDIHIDETSTFNKNERNAVENILYDYFIKNDLLSIENKMNNTLLQKLGISSLNEKNITMFIDNTNTTDNDIKSFAELPHKPDLWKSVFLKYKENYQRWKMIRLWNVIQHQTVHLITNIYKFPHSIRNKLEYCTFYSDTNPCKPIQQQQKPLFLNKMEIGTINMDCIQAGIKLKKNGYNPVVLNCANQESPAAAIYRRSEGGTQEENLFKRTTLYLSLWPHRDPKRAHVPLYDYSAVFYDDNDEKKDKIEGFYPMDNKHGGVYSKNVYVFRDCEQNGYDLLPLNQRCILSFIAVAAQIHYGGDMLSQQEIIAFQNKIRTIYSIALENGHDSLVLGAMGCGIFGNPPMQVAKIFYDVLVNEFNGHFARVMFAILWDHNSQPQLVQSFMKYFPNNDKIFEKM